MASFVDFPMIIPERVPLDLAQLEMKLQSYAVELTDETVLRVISHQKVADAPMHVRIKYMVQTNVHDANDRAEGRRYMMCTDPNVWRWELQVKNYWLRVAQDEVTRGDGVLTILPEGVFLWDWQYVQNGRKIAGEEECEYLIKWTGFPGLGGNEWYPESYFMGEGLERILQWKAENLDRLVAVEDEEEQMQQLVRLAMSDGEESDDDDGKGDVEVEGRVRDVPGAAVLHLGDERFEIRVPPRGGGMRRVLIDLVNDDSESETEEEDDAKTVDYSLVKGMEDEDDGCGDL